MTKAKDCTRKCKQCNATFTPTYKSRAVYCYECLPSGRAGGRWYDAMNLYGVDETMWNAMYFEQDGTCPICLDREATVIDHCHETGKVRGLLCIRCNSVLGDMEKPGRLVRALDYLEDSRG